MSENTAFQIENLIFFYNGDEETAVRNVLNDINVSIEEGSFTAIIGHNGSGKSTLAKHMNGLLLPKGGTVYAFGMDTKDDSVLLELRRRVGMVFQNPDNQIVSNVVEEDVAFAPENLGIPPEEIRQRVDRALKAVGMYEFRNHAPHLLSGGQKQRVAIAGVLAMQPKCIVFDEPTAMLDPSGREDVINLIRSLRERGDVTIILITHHMEEAAYADRVIVMSDGKICMDGTPREVFSHVEELREIGLTVPAPTELIYELRKEGLEIPSGALSIDECAESIYEYFKK